VSQLWLHLGNKSIALEEHAIYRKRRQDGQGRSMPDMWDCNWSDAGRGSENIEESGEINECPHGR
jgi:hypothetical protein